MFQLKHMVEILKGAYLLWLLDYQVTYSRLPYISAYKVAFILTIVQLKTIKHAEKIKPFSSHSISMCCGIHMIKLSCSLGMAEIKQHHSPWKILSFTIFNVFSNIQHNCETSEKKNLLSKCGITIQLHTMLSWGNILWAKQYKKFGQIPSLVDLNNNSQNISLYVQNLMNHTVITYRDWNWSWQNGEEENTIVAQP